MLNPTKYLEQVKEWEKILESSRPAYTEAQLAPTTFEAGITSRLAGQEVSPELKARQKEVISELLTTPGEARQTLGEAGVRPAEISQIVSGRMQGYFDQLEGIQNTRKARQQRIDDIIKSVSEGLKAEAVTTKESFQAIKDNYDRAWDQYREAVKQMEHAQTTKILDEIKRSQTTNKNLIYDEFVVLRNKEIEKQKKIHGDEWQGAWDGGLDPNEYIKLVNKAENLMPGYGKDWFLEIANPFKQLSMDNEETRNILKDGGIDLTTLASKATTDELKVQLKDDLDKMVADKRSTEKDFQDIFNFYKKTKLDFFGGGTESQETESMFEHFLIERFGETMGDEILSKLFGE